MRCTMHICYWNGGGYCVCELEVASLIPDSDSCPNFEEEAEKDDPLFSTQIQKPELEVASLIPDSDSCPNFEEEAEKDDPLFSTQIQKPEPEG